jgi:hypothetical protein
MCPCAPPRILRTCCTASTAKRQDLETTQKAGSYTYFPGLDVTSEHGNAVDFPVDMLSSHFAAPGDSRFLASLGMTNGGAE